MTKTIALPMLSLLLSCGVHKPPSLIPQGNMPMTEQEYQEAEMWLLKEEKLSPGEHRMMPSSEIFER